MDELVRMRAEVFKALGHPIRLEIVEFLLAGERGKKGARTAGDIAEHVGTSQPNVSRHLAVLKAVGIVGDEKSGPNVYYELKMRCIGGFLSCVAEAIDERRTRRASR